MKSSVPDVHPQETHRFTGTSDVATAGLQESNLDEGQICGGVSVEDSSSV